MSKSEKGDRSSISDTTLISFLIVGIITGFFHFDGIAILCGLVYAAGLITDELGKEK